MQTDTCPYCTNWSPGAEVCDECLARADRNGGQLGLVIDGAPDVCSCPKNKYQTVLNVRAWNCPRHGGHRTYNDDDAEPIAACE